MLGIEDFIHKVIPPDWRLLCRRSLAYNRVLVYEHCDNRMNVELSLALASGSFVIHMVASFPQRIPTQNEMQKLIPILLKQDLPISGITWVPPTGLFANANSLRARITLRPL